MNFEISGKLIEIYSTTTVNDKFKKREFVIEKTETKNSFDFTDYVKFQLTQDKCNLADTFKIGESVKVSFNIRGNRWQKDGATSYFTNLDVWKMEKISTSPEIPANAEFPVGDIPLPTNSDFNLPSEELDDLPF